MIFSAIEADYGGRDFCRRADYQAGAEMIYPTDARTNFDVMGMADPKRRTALALADRTVLKPPLRG